MKRITRDRRLTPDELNALVAEVQALAPPHDVEVAAHVALAVAFASDPARGGADEDLADSGPVSAVVARALSLKTRSQV